MDSEIGSSEGLVLGKLPGRRVGSLELSGELLGISELAFTVTSEAGPVECSLVFPSSRGLMKKMGPAPSPHLVLPR